MAVSRFLKSFSGRDAAAVITPADINRRLEILDDFEHAGIGWLWATDAQGRLIYISENAAEKLNRPVQELLAHPITHLFESDASTPGERSERPLNFQLTARNRIVDQTVRFTLSQPQGRGRQTWWSLSGHPKFDKAGVFQGYRGSAKDITIEHERKLVDSRLAEFDSLTGLANRHRMDKKLESTLAAYKSTKRSCALMMLDLDRFKAVNDTLGHSAGDTLLCQVARRLERAVGNLGEIGRLGGDEFQIILPDCDDRGKLGELSNKLIQILSQPYIIDDKRATIGISIGIAISPFDGVDKLDLIDNADLALYAAKNGGRGQFRFYAAHLKDEAAERSVLVGWPDATTSEAIRAGLPDLWESYVGISSQWEPRAFLDRLAPLLDNLKDDPEVLIHFARRVTDAYAMRAVESRDRFNEIQVRAACAVALLPFSDETKVAHFLAGACVEIAALVERAVSQAVSAIDKYQFALVTGGMGDLYYLPLRISKLLGWAGFAVHVRLAISGEVVPARQCLVELFSRIFDTYSLSLVAMSDAQAPYIMSVLTASSRLGLHDKAERLLGHLFSSCIDCAGRVARSDLDPSKVLSYLVARGNPTASPTNELVAQPTELVLTLLRASQLFDLNNEFNAALIQLDHLALNAYLPDDYRNFGAETVAGGTNAVFHIGHDIWNIAEIDAAWPHYPSPPDPGTAMTVLLASLLFPDRSAWFLLPSPSLING